MKKKLWYVCSAVLMESQRRKYIIPSNLRHSLQWYQWQPLCTPPYFLFCMENLAITLKIHRYNIHSIGELLNTATKFFETGILTHFNALKFITHRCTSQVQCLFEVKCFSDWNPKSKRSVL